MNFSLTKLLNQWGTEMKQTDHNNIKPRRIRLVVAVKKTASIKLESSAIAVRILNKPVARFPLKNLLSIQLIGNYTGSVLPFICCAKQGIPVIFFSTRGKLEAILSGKASEQIKLVNWLEYCEFDLEYQKTYNYWLENQIRHLCSTSGISGNSPENMIDSLYYLSSKYISTKFNKIARNELSAWLEGMAKVEITLIAADHGLSPESQLSNKVQVDLLPVLLAFLTTLFAGWSKNNKAKTINPEIMSSFYNEIYDRFEYEVIRMLQQLKSRFESLNS